jgi:pantoate--beta-alanine ligase
MQVFTTVTQIAEYLQYQKGKGRSAAFVPTLGALHEGHLALMDHARILADMVITSIYVNPGQFNDPEDLKKYPRPLANDIHLLCTREVDVLFLPRDTEIYPPGIKISVPADLSALTGVMEGPLRPGHFEGVVKVVKRLLDIVRPDYLIMGQKDYQQQAIINSMIRQLGIPTLLITHPTRRDADGLALSSRNTRIDPTLRPKAGTLHRALQEARKLYPRYRPAEVEEKCAALIRDQGFRLEYFTLADGITLQPVSAWDQHEKIVAFVAAWLGEVRLIDNEVIKG